MHLLQKEVLQLRPSRMIYNSADLIITKILPDPEANMSKIDLHSHSIYSCDGEYTPAQLIHFAKEAGLQYYAVSDHNTTKAVKETIALGAKENICVIPAVELDCMWNGYVFHVLGYGIDPDFPRFREIDEEIMRLEYNAARERVRLFNEAGIEIDEAEALAHAKDGCFVTGEIIAEILLNKPDAHEKPELLPYLPGGSRSDNPYVNFFWDFCDVGKPAYIEIPYISMSEAIDTIHRSGGVAVLAHPGNNLKKMMEALPDVLDEGFDGIEVYSTYHTPEQVEIFKAAAKERGLLITGGSDFHGKTKPSIHMGKFGLEEDGLDYAEALVQRFGK